MRCLWAMLFVVAMNAHSAGVSGQGTWEATLQARDVNRDGVVDAYYDTSLKITWLADAGNFVPPDELTGVIAWDRAVTWANSLKLGGVDGWRLPHVFDMATVGCDFAYSGSDCGYNVDTTGSEMAHMFYVTLGNLAAFSEEASHSGRLGLTSHQFDSPVRGLTNTGPFSGLTSDSYWSGSESALYPSFAWYFSMPGGLQDEGNKQIGSYAWAVRDGDIAAVPEPHSYVLMIAGLLGLGVSLTKRRTGLQSGQS